MITTAEKLQELIKRQEEAEKTKNEAREAAKKLKRQLSVEELKSDMARLLLFGIRSEILIGKTLTYETQDLIAKSILYERWPGLNDLPKTNLDEARALRMIGLIKVAYADREVIKKRTRNIFKVPNIEEPKNEELVSEAEESTPEDKPTEDTEDMPESTEDTPGGTPPDPQTPEGESRP